MTRSTGVYVNTQIDAEVVNNVYAVYFLGQNIITNNLLFISSSITLTQSYANKYFTTCSIEQLGSSVCYNETSLLQCNFQKTQTDLITQNDIKIGYCSKPELCDCGQQATATSGTDSYCQCNNGYFVADSTCKQQQQDERDQKYYYDQDSCNENYTYNDTTKYCYKNCDQSCKIVSTSDQDCQCSCEYKILVQDQKCSENCETGYYYQDGCHIISKNKKGTGYILDTQFIYTSCEQEYKLEKNDCVYTGFGDKQIQIILIVVIVCVFVISVILLIISSILSRKTKAYNLKLMN